MLYLFYSFKTDINRETALLSLILTIETLERVPSNYLKHLVGTDGLYEARIQLQLGSNICRTFCFFDGNKLVILMNGFEKKSRKTPKNQIDKASRIMIEYYEQKSKSNGN